MPAEDAPRAKGGRCPVCGAASEVKTRPFCSPRCRDVDLHRWLSGSYAIPVADDEAYTTAAHMVDGLDERDARIAALEQKLSEMREAVNMLRKPMALLLEMHPDDLEAE